MIDNSLASFTLPASEMGERTEFKTGFKANLVEMIAAIRLSRRYGGGLQKSPAPKGHATVQVTLDDLRSTLNTRAGLNEHGVDRFIQIFVKSVFNELTKPNWKFFPGKWIHSLKQTNNVKNNVGIVYKLGYEPKVANYAKVLQVVNTRVQPKAGSKPIGRNKDGKPRFESKSYEMVALDDKKNPEGINHQEFRLCMFLMLPLIDPKDKRSPKDQLLRDPLTVKDKHVCDFYSKNRDVVDAVNLAYATKVSVGRKGSKATPLGFKSARGHSIRLSANREWMDASGNKYQKLADVPEHTRTYLMTSLRRKISKEDSDSEHDSDSEEEKEPVKTTGPKKEKE